MGTILDSGNEYEQPVKVVFKQVKATRNADQNVEVTATAATGMSTPKVAKRAAVAVTVSSKKARRT